MAEQVWAYVGHLSRHELAVLQAFDARIHELKVAGEVLGFYEDLIPILCGCAHEHYRSKRAAKKAFFRLADFLTQQARLYQQTEGRA